MKDRSISKGVQRGVSCLPWEPAAPPWPVSEGLPARVQRGGSTQPNHRVWSSQSVRDSFEQIRNIYLKSQKLWILFCEALRFPKKQFIPWRRVESIWHQAAFMIQKVSRNVLSEQGISVFEPGVQFLVTWAQTKPHSLPTRHILPRNIEESA